MRRTIFSLVVLLGLLTGCATRVTQEQRAAEYIENAKAALASGNSQRFQNSILSALVWHTGDEQAARLFKNNPNSKALLLQSLRERIFEVTIPSEAVQTQETLNRFRTTSLVDSGAIDQLSQELLIKVAALHQNGTSPFSFADNPELFPVLLSEESMALLIDKTISDLQKSDRSPAERKGNLEGLRNYFSSPNSNPKLRQKIKASLQSFKPSKSELAIISSIDEDFASTQMTEMLLAVEVVIKGADRLFKDDLEKSLKNSIHGLQIVESGAPSQIVLTVERLREEERQSPPRTETVSYRQHEVNLVAAALLMPRNASYMYDVVSGVSEIEYGYLIIIQPQAKKSREMIVRGKVGGQYIECRNARVQNVFGGVERADFIANQDMSNRCTGNSEISRDSLRSLVFDRVVSAIREIEEFKAIHQRNL